MGASLLALAKSIYYDNKLLEGSLLGLLLQSCTNWMQQWACELA